MVDFATKIADFLKEQARAARSNFTHIFDNVMKLFDAEARAQVGFSVAMIALSAKMAKADGVVTQDEVNAFYDLVAFPEEEAQHVRMLYDLARQDIAGYDVYARRIAKMFKDDSDILEDVLDSLFLIAKADGVLHQHEDVFLSDIAQFFGLNEHIFEQLKARHFYPDRHDPYAVLGGDASMPLEDLRKLFIGLVKKHHPDSLLARGVPEAFLQMSSKRMIAINEAWEVVQERHK